MKRTLQEWADFTGWYVAMDLDGIVWAFKGKPTRYKEQWFEMSIETNATAIDKRLTVPFPGDWRDSLHSPRVVCPDCNGDGYIGSMSSASYPAIDHVNTGTSAITYLKKECPTCHGAGWVEREEQCIL